MDSMSGCDIRLVFICPLKTVHCSTKHAFTSEITFLALVPMCIGNFLSVYPFTAWNIRFTMVSFKALLSRKMKYPCLSL